MEWMNDNYGIGEICQLRIISFGILHSAHRCAFEAIKSSQTEKDHGDAGPTIKGEKKTVKYASNPPMKPAEN